MADLRAFLTRLQRDYTFLLEFRKDPVAVLDQFDISDDDKRRVVTKDPWLRYTVESSGLNAPPRIRQDFSPDEIYDDAGGDDGDDGDDGGTPPPPPPPPDLYPPPPPPPPIDLSPPPTPPPPPPIIQLPPLLTPTWPIVSLFPPPYPPPYPPPPVWFPPPPHPPLSSLAPLVDAVRSSEGPERHSALLQLMENL